MPDAGINAGRGAREMPFDELGVGIADGVAAAADADRFQHTRVTQLREHELLIEVVRCLMSMRIASESGERERGTCMVLGLMQRM